MLRGKKFRVFGQSFRQARSELSGSARKTLSGQDTLACAPKLGVLDGHPRLQSHCRWVWRVWGGPIPGKPILGKEKLDKMASVASTCWVAMPEINQELHMHTR